MDTLLSPRTPSVGAVSTLPTSALMTPAPGPRPSTTAIFRAPVDAGRLAAAAHRHRMTVADQLNEASEITSSDEAAATALGKMSHARSEQEVSLIWQWIKRRRALFNALFPSNQAEDENIRLVCRNLHLLNVPASSIVYEQGDAGDAVFFVVTGSVKIYHHSFTSEGKIAYKERRTSRPASQLGPMAAEGDDFGPYVTTVNSGEMFGLSPFRSTSAAIRAETAISQGRSASSLATAGPARLLQIPGVFYRSCPQTRIAWDALLARTQALSRLILFDQWPREELEFMARFMVDKCVREVRFTMPCPAMLTVSQGEVLSDGGSQAYAAFVTQGALQVSGGSIGATDEKLVLEIQHAPGFVGADMSTELQRYWNLKFTAFEDSVVACLAHHFLQRLIFDQTNVPYKRRTLRTITVFHADREVWYDVRQESSREAQVLLYDFMLPVQAALVTCASCGEKGHTNNACPALIPATSARGRSTSAPTSQVSSQLYAMGNVFIRRILDEAAKAGEDWNLAINIRRKRLAHKAVSGVMNGVGIIVGWIQRRRARRNQEAHAEAVKQARVQAAIAAFTSHSFSPKKKRNSPRQPPVHAKMDVATPSPTARRHSSPGMKSPAAQRALELFEPIVSPNNLKSPEGANLMGMLARPSTGRRTTSFRLDRPSTSNIHIRSVQSFRLSNGHGATSSSSMFPPVSSAAAHSHAEEPRTVLTELSSEITTTTTSGVVRKPRTSLPIMETATASPRAHGVPIAPPKRVAVLKAVDENAGGAGPHHGHTKRVYTVKRFPLQSQQTSTMLRER